MEIDNSPTANAVTSMEMELVWPPCPRAAHLQVSQISCTVLEDPNSTDKCVSASSHLAQTRSWPTGGA